MLVFHSGSGSGSRSEQGQAFVTTLKKAGVDAELIPSMKQSHADINRQFGTPGDMVTEAAMRFLNRVRGNTGGDRASTDAKLSAAASATHVGSQRRRPPADPVQPASRHAWPRRRRSGPRSATRLETLAATPWNDERIVPSAGLSS